MVERRNVVIAHESETIREVIRRLCLDAGYAVRAVGDGRAALAALDERPDALVLDVALPEVHAYEVVERAKQRLPALRVVLVASIYNRTGYKRRPTSLYGADDYVEQHHIPDALVEKLERLIGAAVAPTMGSANDAVAVRHAGEAREAGTANAREPPPDPVQRAVRLARLIVSDIALYNGDALDGSVSSDELLARLRVDLEEGRLLFDLRVPAEVRRTRDFIGEALDELTQKRRASG